MTIQSHHLHTHGPDPMHTDKRRDKARIIAKENGISVRQAYADSERSGKCYEAAVRYVEALEKIQAENY